MGKNAEVKNSEVTVDVVILIDAGFEFDAAVPVDLIILIGAGLESVPPSVESV